MKGCRKHRTLPRGDDALRLQRWMLIARQYLDLRADARYERRSDEYPTEGPMGLLEGWDIEIHLEAVNLSTKSVAFNDDVHGSDTRLVAPYLTCQQDQACTGAPEGETTQRQIFDRIQQFMLDCKLAHDGALAAWKHQPIQMHQLRRQPHLDRLGTHSIEPTNVLAKITLKRQHADARHSITSLGPQAADLQGWRRSPALASAHPDPLKRGR